ncbi:MAG: hypothetical protein HN982_03055 [Candidatus Marinimicrobia bacterium]|jgi:hypothetical protein|nr:hypothetical protein [Candidatus Neomarinimicrobiota bacterium]
MKHTKLSQEETEQLTKNIQMGIELDDSFKTIKWNYSYNMGFEKDTLLNRGFTPSESKSLIDRAMFLACLKYDFRENGSLWAATKYQLKTELAVEMDSINGKGLMVPRGCPTDKDLNPYTCNNQCGEQNSLGTRPCRINKRKDLNKITIDLNAEDKKDKYSDENDATKSDKVENRFDYYSELAPQTDPDLLQFSHVAHTKYEILVLAKRKVLDALKHFPDPLKSVFTDYLPFKAPIEVPRKDQKKELEEDSKNTLTYKELSEKYKKPKSVIKDLIEEGFFRLRDNNISQNEFML